MDKLQKIGGVAAFIEAATFLFGFALLATVLAPLAAGELDREQTVAFLADNNGLLYTWNLVIYVVFGAFLVVLSLALYERLKAGSPALAPIATAFGLIWAGLVIASGMVANIGTRAVIDLYASDPAQAGSVWVAVDTVRNGLGGGNEIVGGIWVLLLSWAALRGGGLPKAINYLGLVIGLAGLVTVIPVLGDLGGAVFGLAQIVWFLWLGFVLLRGRREPFTESQSATASEMAKFA